MLIFSPKLMLGMLINVMLIKKKLRRAVTRKRNMVGQKYFRGGGKLRLGEGQKYIKYSKINNNLENFMRGKIASRRDSSPLGPLSFGPDCM